jgi:hypothetical protein
MFIREWGRLGQAVPILGRRLFLLRQGQPVQLRMFRERIILALLRFTIRRVVDALLLVPFKVSIRAMRERNAGNHADKTSPRCSMGCRGWGESRGPYPSSS